jgi:hypothetical protein
LDIKRLRAFLNIWKVEKGQAIPSSIVINQIAKALDTNSGQAVILAFCSNQFESFDYLFKTSNLKEINHEEETNLTSITQGQKELSKFQISCLHDKQENYFLFLLLTLSRGPISTREISEYSGISPSIDILVNAGLAVIEGEFVLSTSSEFRFPRSKDLDVNRVYKDFDEWDVEFSHQFDFEKLVNKMMIRRISPRYLSAIQKQVDIIADFVRLSDESDQIHNNDVLHLQVKLSRGQLPG